MNVLGLDLGLRTGWAIRLASGGVIHGTERLDRVGIKRGRDKEKSKDYIDGCRFLEFRRWLGGLLDDHGVRVICYERVRRHLGCDAAHYYGGFRGIMLLEGYVRDCVVMPLHVQHIKEFISGDGSASKEVVMSSVRSAGFSPIDDNAADAISMVLYCCVREM